MSLTGSESDFWAELSLVHFTQKPDLQISQVDLPLSEVCETFIPQPSSQEPSRQLDRLHQQIEILRTAKEVEVRNAEIVLRKNLQVTLYTARV